VRCVLLFVLLVGYSLSHDHEHDHEEDRFDSAEHQYVTCGSVIKLRNIASGYRLHSHQVTYGTGSGQQSVTGFPGSDDNNSYWVVKGGFGKDCITGTPIANGDIIRLEHSTTSRNLHSHLHSSPLTHQQEVSCFNEGDNGDSGDNWIVKPVTSSSTYWIRGGQIRFQHSDTSKFLQMTSSSFGNPIPGQREIVCSAKQTDDTKWTSEEGIYFPHARIN